MQSAPDGEFKWIMHYQDHLTKFSYLRALPNKKASRVALELLKIFLMQGAPMILQSDNGSEFIASIIQDLKDLWPACNIVHGRARHPRDASVEKRVVFVTADATDATNPVRILISKRNKFI